jgi:hypothetical protein
MNMKRVHSFKAGDKVTVFQMSPSKGLFIEGSAKVVGRIPDVDEYYDVIFDNEPHEVYPRFIDRAGQLHPDGYVTALNRKLRASA